jgi:hypothetical protein
MKNLIILPCLILACAFLTGCIGLVVAHPKQKCTEQFCLGSRGTITNGPAATQLTEANVLELWGQPDAKRIETNAVTVWRYQGERKWTFIVPMYLIGVPLPFPAGHDQVELYFQDGIARKASRPVTVITGVCIGEMFVFAWEKEDSAKQVVVGSGFVEEDNPAQAKP